MLDVLDQMEKYHVQINVLPENIVLQEHQVAQNVQPEHIHLMKDQVVVKIVEPENGVPPEVQHVVI